MTSTRRFCCDDLFRFSSTNLDVLTETVSTAVVAAGGRSTVPLRDATHANHAAASCLPRTFPAPLQYHVPFYLTYLSRWPDMCAMQESPSGKIMSYSEHSARLCTPLTSSAWRAAAEPLVIAAEPTRLLWSHVLFNTHGLQLLSPPLLLVCVQ